MEDAFMNFLSAMEARDAVFTKLTTTTRNLTAQLRQQEDQIWALQAGMYNLKVTAAAQKTDIKGPNKGEDNNTHARENPERSGQPTPIKINTTIKNTAGPMDMAQATHIHLRHAQGQILVTKRTLHAATQVGNHKKRRHTYQKNYEGESGR